jgi:hypothetical protein
MSKADVPRNSHCSSWILCLVAWAECSLALPSRSNTPLVRWLGSFLRIASRNFNKLSYYDAEFAFSPRFWKWDESTPWESQNTISINFPGGGSCYAVYCYPSVSSNQSLHSCVCRNLNRAPCLGTICDFRTSLRGFLCPAANCFTRKTLPTVKGNCFFMTIFCVKSFGPQKKKRTTERCSPQVRSPFWLWNQPLNMWMRVCYV